MNQIKDIHIKVGIQAIFEEQRLKTAMSVNNGRLIAMMLLCTLFTTMVILTPEIISFKFMIAGYVSIGSVTLNALIVRFYYKKHKKYNVLLSYISHMIEASVLAIVLLNASGPQIIKSQAFIIIFIIISLSTSLFSRRLILLTGLFCTISYLTVFIVSAATGLIELGNMRAEYFTEAVSPFSVILKMGLFWITVLILSFVSGNYKKMTDDYVKQVSTAHQAKAETINMQNTFRRYLDVRVIEQMISEDNVNLKGEKKMVSVLFCDVRDFTKISDNLSAEEIVGLLNTVLPKLTDVVMKNHGIIDKFMGDGFLAVFGAPIHRKDSHFMAVKTSLELIKIAKKITIGRGNLVNMPLKLGIGIATGNVIAGNIGSEQRMDYTVIGTPVNLAARLEKLNKEYGTSILIAERTQEKVKSCVTTKIVGNASIRGLAKKENVYTVLAINKKKLADVVSENDTTS